MDFSFRAPAFYDATATAAESNTVYHDAPATGERLAKFKRFAMWLREELAKDGILGDGPTHDEGGWLITVPEKQRLFRKKTGFVLIVVDVVGTGDQPFKVSVSPIG